MARTSGSHSGITGPRIKAAALRLFARHGFAAVSMRQIAGEVGVQAGALYNYTPDKQSLLLHLMVTHMEDLLAEAAQLSETEPLARLEEFTRFHIAQNRDRSDEVFIAYMELRNLTPENFAKVEAMRQGYEATLEDILKAGVAAEVFDVTDTRVTTRALIAMLNGVNTWFRDDGALSLKDVQDVHWHMVRRAISIHD
jgi:AcrR family transcriptional regulator